MLSINRVEKGPTDSSLVMSKVGLARFQYMIAPGGPTHRLATCDGIFVWAIGIDPRNFFAVDIEQCEEAVPNERFRYILELRK